MCVLKYVSYNAVIVCISKSTSNTFMLVRCIVSQMLTLISEGAVLMKIQAEVFSIFLITSNVKASFPLKYLYSPLTHSYAVFHSDWLIDWYKCLLGGEHISMTFGHLKLDKLISFRREHFISIKPVLELESDLGEIVT